MEEVNGSVPVVAGGGSNDTSVAVRKTQMLASLGVDAVLSVAPYYNKPTQEGLYRHFRAVAEDGGIATVVYNVPGRTASSIRPDTLARLSELENVVAVKEASGDLGNVMEIVRNAPDLTVLSGDDALTLPMLILGARGVISVVANETPGPMQSMVQKALAGDWEGARQVHYRLLPLMNANFLESNPIPVKAALAILGVVEEEYRLPLVPPSQRTRDELHRLLYMLQLLNTSETS
jgi:4-hydroxy-tetrahydrodipicolinate synthase